jgi:putative transposase
MIGLENKQFQLMSKPTPNIRTDIWNIAPSDDQSVWLRLTVAEYRLFLKPLVLIGYWNWNDLSELTANERVNHLEKLFHRTEQNPAPKSGWYFDKAVANHPSFRQFPSYLRRAAIQDALGIVSSFVTRWESWKAYDRKHKTDKPPRLTAMCNSYPALYRGNQIQYSQNYSSFNVKVWNGTDWVWSGDIAITKHGKGRLWLHGYEVESPSLIANRKGIHLSMPHKFKFQKMEESGYVTGVDLGINNAATVAAVGRDGTVKAREFINPARDIDQRDRRRMMMAARAKKTTRRTGEDLPRKFCQGLYRKSSNINEAIAQQVSTAIVSFAQVNQTHIIVFEDLSHWKAKAGKRKSLQKQRFHNWCKDRIVELTKQKAAEVGIKVAVVNAKYTSAYAYDGSGKVKRDAKNYSLAVFKTGKKYACDLSAAYNIGARYWYKLVTKSKHDRVWEMSEASPIATKAQKTQVAKLGKRSRQTQRLPVTLSTLWKLVAS